MKICLFSFLNVQVNCILRVHLFFFSFVCVDLFETNIDQFLICLMNCQFEWKCEWIWYRTKKKRKKTHWKIKSVFLVDRLRFFLNIKNECKLQINSVINTNFVVFKKRKKNRINWVTCTVQSFVHISEYSPNSGYY